MPHNIYSHGHFTGPHEEVQYNVSLGLLEMDGNQVAHAGRAAFGGQLKDKAKATIRYQVSVG